ncbi:hypothetical protein BDU57DRAFT_439926 [Ampelomyces quisqualis]|uniref:Polynucleotide 5'-hydroxyl-kinase GRC3 n=1 Tax=Ampelomyces quisqualis TaxID=50730 RepID=A0A6A5R2Y0_AMPQU|nr:hypothetical protein BDU57DRAFT_439926 [Ampelomyces quisqualis]
MPAKRRRVEDSQAANPAPTNNKPLSAIAAARLRAESAVKGVVAPEITPEPVPEPSVVVPPSPSPQHQESEPNEEPLAVRQNLKLCSWRNEPQNVLSDTSNELTVKLPKHTTISLVGCFHFKVLRGAINVNGANIGALSREGQQAPTYTSHVPATHPLSKIRGLDGMNHVQFITCEEPRPLAATSTLFADIWNVSTRHGKSKSFDVITESKADVLGRPLCPETSPEDWLRVVEDCAAEPSIVLTVGASATGKSTFGRRLLNRYLTGQGKSARPLPAACYLDLDPFKSEYTPHGQISLIMVRSLNLGPGFSHPVTTLWPSGTNANEIIRAHAVPPNLTNYRDYYSACVEDLFLAYKSLHSRDPLLPLIVNTPGSLYISDFDLLTTLITRIKPHYAVHLGDRQAIDMENETKLPLLQTVVSQYRGTMHEIAANIPASAPMRTDAELRAMQMESYFHLAKQSPAHVSLRAWLPNPVSELVPWELCYEETEDRLQDFVCFAMYSEPVEPRSLLHALTGSIVQLVESTSSVIPSPYTAQPRTRKHRVPYLPKSDRTGMVHPLDPKTSKLICTALIRGFDVQKRLVQISVPQAHDDSMYTLIPERTVLVGGCCDPPEWAYLEDAHAATSTPSSQQTQNIPWLETKDRTHHMGYLNTLRRVRKFHN